MSRKRKAALAAGIAVLLIVFLVVLAFGLLQTGASKRQLASYISSMLTDTLAWDINIEGLSGNVPFNMHVDSITIEDAEGRWLEIRQLTIDAVFMGFVGRRVELDEISAEYIEVVRAPTPKPQPDDPEPWSAPQLPRLPEWLIIHDIQIDELVLGEALLAGEEATFTAEGALVPRTTEGSQIRLTLVRTDKDTTKLDLDANLANDELTLDLDAYDAAILPRLTNTAGPAKIALEGSGPLTDWSAKLVAEWGDTPLLDATLTLAAEAGIDVQAEAEVNLDHPLVPAAVVERFGNRAQLTSDFSISGENVLTLRSVLVETPQAALELAGTAGLEAKTLDLRAAFKHEQADLLLPLREHEGDVPLAATFTANGAFAAPELRMQAQLAEQEVLHTAVSLQIDQGLAWTGEVVLHPTPLLVPEQSVELLGQRVEARVTGTYSPERILTVESLHVQASAADISGDAILNWPDKQLAADLDAKIERLGVFGAFTDIQLAGAANVNLKVSGDDAGTQFSATFDGSNILVANAAAEALNLQVSGSAGAWPEHIDENLSAQAEGAARGLVIDGRAVPPLQLAADVAAPNFEHIEVHGLRLHNDTLQLSAKGEVWPQEPRADLDLALDVQSLETYAGIFDQEYSGQLSMIAQAKTQGPEQTSFTGTVRWTNPGGLPEPVPAVLGETLVVETEGALEDNTLRIAKLDVNAAHLQAIAQGSYGLESQQIEATAEIVASELEAAAEAAGVPLSGSLTLTATATGTPEALEVVADASGSNLQYQDYQVDDLQLALDAQGLPQQPQGTLNFTLVEQGETIQGDAQLDYAQQVITVPALEIAMGVNRITGELQYNLETQAGSGTLDANLPELGALETFTGQPIRGALFAEAQVEAEDGQSNLILEARAEDVQMPFGAVQQAQLDVNVRQLFESPQGDVRLSASGFEQGAVALNELTLTVSGGLAQADVVANVQGTLPEVADFQADLRADASIEDQRVQLAAFNGDFGEYSFALADAARFTWSDSGFALSPLELQFQEGTIRLAGDLSETAVDLQANWSNLPLDISELFTEQAINGQLGGQLSITGNPASPQVRLQTQTENLRMAFGEQDLPPLLLEARATADGEQAQVQAEVQLADAGGANLQASLPLDLSLMPWRFELPQGGALDGELNADLQLQPLPRLLALQGHLLMGRLEGSFDLAGTVSEPLLEGQALLVDGRYENATTGTILTDLQAEIDADGRQLTLTRLTARDPTGGSVRAEGQMLLDPNQSFPYEATAELQEARVVHRDDVSTKATGTLRAEGNLEEGTATGDIAVGPGVVNIPQEFGDDDGPADVPTIQYTSVQQLEERDAAGEAQEAAEGGMTLNLNIDADVPSRIFVRGQGLDSEWRGDLQIRGTASNPAITGVLTMIKGTLTVFGRRFEFEESTLTFDGDSPPSPYMNLSATADAADVTALLYIRGTLDNLDIELSSNPPLPEDEVLARVLFGRDASEISPVQALQLAQYARSLTGGKSGFNVLGALQKIPGLDRLDFRQGAGAGETAIGVGRYLTEDIYIEVEQGLGSDSSRVSVELELTPQITVEGTAGAGGESRAGIFWKKDY